MSDCRAYDSSRHTQAGANFFVSISLVCEDGADVLGTLHVLQSTALTRRRNVDRCAPSVRLLPCLCYRTGQYEKLTKELIRTVCVALIAPAALLKAKKIREN